MPEYPIGTASMEAVLAEASPETQAALAEQESTAVAPLTTADAPKAKKAGKKKGK